MRKPETIQQIKDALAEHGWHVTDDKREDPFTLVPAQDREKRNPEWSLSGHPCEICGSVAGTAIAFEGYKLKEGASVLRYVCAHMPKCQAHLANKKEQERARVEQRNSDVLAAVKLPD